MRSSLWIALGLALAPGCRQIIGIDPPRAAPGDGAGGDDGGGGDDAVGVPSDAGYCYGAAGFSMCFDTAPTGSLALSVSINTGTSGSCATSLPASWTGAGQPDVCLVAANDITISSDLRVTGTRPLVLVAAVSIDIPATLDASSHLTTHGAGGGSPSCTTATAPGVNVNGGGGGAGGTLATPGKQGGSFGGVGGTACPAASSDRPLRGGPNGQAGATGMAGPPNAGLGGGAVFLAAGTSISISGAINTSGGGGFGGTYYAGGSGGGAGGMIALYAPAITAFGTLMTNGGGGGTAGSNNGVTGYGSDPSLTMPLVGGAGGTQAGQATGGNGCGHGTPATAGANGGGGGGGGCGFILSNQALDNAIVSPGVSPF